jgi:hypothetical protein
MSNRRGMSKYRDQLVEARHDASQDYDRAVLTLASATLALSVTLNRPGFDGGSTSWRKMESCQTTPAVTSPRIAIQLS